MKLRPSPRMTVPAWLTGLLLWAGCGSPAAAAERPSPEEPAPHQGACEVSASGTTVQVRGGTAYWQRAALREQRVTDWVSAYDGDGGLSYALFRRVRVTGEAVEVRPLFLWQTLSIDPESGDIRGRLHRRVASFAGACSTQDIALGLLSLLQLAEEPGAMKTGRAADGLVSRAVEYAPPP